MATSADKRTKSKTKKSSRRGFGAGSFLLSRTSRLSARITWSFRRGIASKALCTADRVEQSLHNGLAANLSEKTGFRELISAPVKKAVAVGTSKSVLFARGDGLRRAFLHTKARFFGVALFYALIGRRGTTSPLEIKLEEYRQSAEQATGLTP